MLLKNDSENNDQKVFRFTLWDTNNESPMIKPFGSPEEIMPFEHKLQHKDSPTFNNPFEFILPQNQKMPSDELPKFSLDDVQRTISFAPNFAYIQAQREKEKERESLQSLMSPIVETRKAIGENVLLDKDEEYYL